MNTDRDTQTETRQWRDDYGPTTITVDREGDRWYVYNDGTGTAISRGYPTERKAIRRMEAIASGASIHDE